MVAAVIPAYNEASRIGPVLQVLRVVDCVDEIIVVDDGSTDETFAEVQAAAAQDGRIRCVRLERNGGKAGALLAGAQTATQACLLFLDADLIGLRPDHLAALIGPVSDGQVDMTVGRFWGGRWNTDLSHWLTPYLSGQRCVLRSNFLELTGQAEAGYGIEIALTMAARRGGWRCRTVVLSGVTHPPSEFHRGLFFGAGRRLRMYGQILSTWKRGRGWELLLPRWPMRPAMIVSCWPSWAACWTNLIAARRRRP